MTYKVLSGTLNLCSLAAVLIDSNFYFCASVCLEKRNWVGHRDEARKALPIKCYSGCHMATKKEDV